MKLNLLEVPLNEALLACPAGDIERESGSDVDLGGPSAGRARGVGRVRTVKSSIGKCVLKSESSKTEDRGETWPLPIGGRVFGGSAPSRWAKLGRIGRGELHGERSSMMDESDEVVLMLANEEESAEGASGLLGREPSAPSVLMLSWDRLCCVIVEWVWLAEPTRWPLF